MQLWKGIILITEIAVFVYLLDGYEHGDGEDAHEEVASGTYVRGDGDGCVCFQYHPQLNIKIYQVQTSGDDSKNDGTS